MNAHRFSITVQKIPSYLKIDFPKLMMITSFLSIAVIFVAVSLSGGSGIIAKVVKIMTFVGNALRTGGRNMDLVSLKKLMGQP